MTTVTEFVAGLRALADWYEQHPDIQAPFSAGTAAGDFIVHARTAEELAAGARALGMATKKFTDHYVELHRDFGGGIELEIYSCRSEVCTGRVVGQRVIPARPKEIIPAQPERVEDIIKWDCGPILAEIKPA